jgi:hypothetical protein
MISRNQFLITSIFLASFPILSLEKTVVYAGVKSGEAEIYFVHDPVTSKLNSEKKFNPEIFIWLSDADHSFKQHLATVLK